MTKHKVTIDGVEYVRSDKAVREALHEAEARLIAGINGLGRDVASDAETADLRRAVMRAKADCAEAGGNSETISESIERTRREDEAALREFARQAPSDFGGVGRAKRTQLAACAAGLAAVATASCFWSPGGLLAGLLVVLVSYLFAYDWLATKYPTLGVAVGKRAFERHLGVLELWPEKSDHARDYLGTYRRLHRRERAAGKSQQWLKVK